MANQTRFTVLTLFIERQLFSIREGADGSISLLFGPATWNIGGKSQPYKDVHITAHSGINHECGFGYKIKRSGLALDKSYFDTSLIVQDKKRRGLIWPITSALTGIHSPREFSMKSGDRKVPLIGFTGVDEALCYTAYATSKHIKLPQIQGFSMIREEFEQLAFTLYVTFLHVHNESVQFHSEENANNLRINGEPYPGTDMRHSSSIRTPMTIHGIERYLQKTHSNMASVFVSVNQPRRADIPLISPTPLSFHRWPSVTDSIHSEFGLMAKVRNATYSAPYTVDGHRKPKDYIENISPITHLSLDYLSKHLDQEDLMKMPEDIRNKLVDIRSRQAD